MSNDLLRFFGKLVPAAQEDVAWLRGAMRLRLRAYLTAELPPMDYVTSVRAVLFSDAGCAVLRNADGIHVLPGGRRQAGESLSETLCRELLEETGCSLRSWQPLGLLHFHHLTAPPKDYPYPYPDLAHAVFVARGAPDEAFAEDPDGHERHVRFVAPSALGEIVLPDYQRVLVAAALRILPLAKDA